MATRIGISGFGAIGRRVFRASLETYPDLQVAAINGLQSDAMMAHLLKYDSTYGILDREVGWREGGISVGDRFIPTSHEGEPGAIPWEKNGVQIVLECTGKFRRRQEAAAHLDAGAKKVIISAPGRGDDLMVVYGVNEADYIPERHHVISNGSCTTNCLVPMVKVLDEAFGLEWGLFTTVHSYTRDQSLLDGAHRDPRRARSAATNIIPTSTGAAKAVDRILPHLKGRVEGRALRVPTPSVSLVDLTAALRGQPDPEAVNVAFREAASGNLQGILGVVDAPVVSTDLRGTSESAIVDTGLTQAAEGRVKVFAWYDNEWAYALRMLDIARYVGELL